MDRRGQPNDGGMPSNNNNPQQQQQQQQQRMQPQLLAPGVMAGVVHENGASTATASQQSQSGGAQAPSAAPGQQSAAMTAPLMMNLMTNPALAAAAAASPLFPPAAMLSNPGAFLAMPEAFAMTQAASAMNGGTAASNSQQPQAGAANQTGLVTLAPGMAMPTGAAMQMANSASNNPASAAPGAAGSTQQQPTPIVPSMTPLVPYNLQQQQPGTTAMASFQVAGAAAAAAAAGDKEKKSNSHNNSNSNNSSRGVNRADLTPEEKAKQNRDRNREHARSTRLRKKAYVQKLKELVECLHAERTEEVRQRRVAIQHLAEKQNVRRSVVRNFLRFHASFERDARKWGTLLEDDFWLKQPVTPYRSFRRAEIEQECRVSRGIEAMVFDSASVAVMIEGIGSRSPRWMQIKREEFTLLEAEQRMGSQRKMPGCIQKQDSRLQHAMSSLSSSSGSSSNHHHHQFSSTSGGEDSSGKEQGGGVGSKPVATSRSALSKPDANAPGKAAKVSSSSGSSNESRNKKNNNPNNNNNNNSTAGDYHDYHAKPLPDPQLHDSEQDESPEDSHGGSASNGDTKRVSTDSSSGDDSAGAVAGPRAAKKRKVEHHHQQQHDQMSAASGASSRGATSLPPNIAKKGGIGHSIRADQLPTGGGSSETTTNGNVRLSMAPAVALPPFAGIGKKRSAPRPVVAGAAAAAAAAAGETQHHHHHRSSANTATTTTGPAVVSADAAESSSRSSSGVGDTKIPQILAQYHLNEDDMILMEDILMCPFVFRSHNAVLCGALSECVTPGMLRAHFSARNKLQSLELVYDAMGFMQQLERASGNEGTAQIIPGSLEMALTPSTTDALVITLAKPPYLIVNVNEVWTRTTGWTQMEVEGREYLTLLEGEGTVPAAGDRPGKPRHKLEDVAKGRCASSTNIHYDKEGRDFIEFVCSYPLTNAANEVTHLLHISKELPSPQEAASASSTTAAGLFVDGSAANNN